MSQFKIDGFILSVNDIYTWINGLITLFRKNKLKRVHLPREIVDIMKKHEADRETADELLAYLSHNDHYMATFVDIVKKGMTELAIEKGVKLP